MIAVGTLSVGGIGSINENKTCAGQNKWTCILEGSGTVPGGSVVKVLQKVLMSRLPDPKCETFQEEPYPLTAQVQYMVWNGFKALISLCFKDPARVCSMAPDSGQTRGSKEDNPERSPHQRQEGFRLSAGKGTWIAVQQNNIYK